MKMKKIVSAILCAALLGVAGTSFVSCDDREADIRTELKGEMGELAALAETLADQIQDLSKLEDQLAACKRECDNNSTRLNAVETKLEQLGALKAELEALAAEVEDLKNRPGGSCDCDLSGFARVADLAAYAKTEDMLRELAGKVSTTDFNDLKNTVEALQRTLEDDYYTSEEVDDLIRDFITADALDGFLTEADLDDYMKIADFKDGVQQILDEGNYMTATDVDSVLAVALPEVMQIIKENVKQVLLQMVTSIEINATVNPIFGGAALPADVRTTVLAAYHGVASQDLSFPNAEILKKAGTGTAIGLEAGQILLDDAENNAGTLYMTINPSTVDLSGLNISLVTSKGEEAPITLTSIEKCDDVELKFGWTRAANGFYKAEAKLEADKIDDAKMNIDFGNLKNSVKNVLEQRSKSSIAKLAANLFSESSDILPAYAVQATYVNSLDGEDTEVNVLSQYSIAATTVKPLSYGFMAGVQYDIPGIERIEKAIGDAIDNVFGQIKKALPDFSELGEIDIKGINLDGVKRTIEVTVKKEDLEKAIDLPEYVTWKDENGKEQKAKLEVKYDDLVIIVELDEFLDSLQGSIDEGLDMAQLNDVLAQLKEISHVGSDLDNMRDELKNKVFSYIDRINGAFNTLTGSVNAALQPCLLFLDNNGNIAGRVSTSKVGTQVKGTSITLVPTSYTAELFAPAYKKFVAVTAVNGKSDDCAKYNKNGLGEVLSGNNWNGLELTGLEAGNTYEITYSAVDYSGVECTKTYYISVK